MYIDVHLLWIWSRNLSKVIVGQIQVICVAKSNKYIVVPLPSLSPLKWSEHISAAFDNFTSLIFRLPFRGQPSRHLPNFDRCMPWGCPWCLAEERWDKASTAGHKQSNLHWLASQHSHLNRLWSPSISYWNKPTGERILFNIANLTLSGGSWSAVSVKWLDKMSKDDYYVSKYSLS